MRNHGALAVALVLLGCSSDERSKGGGSAATTDTGTLTSTETTETTAPEPAAFSYIGEAALTALEQPRHFGDQGQTWGRSIASDVDPGWLLQVPEPWIWGEDVATIEADPTVTPGAGVPEGSYHPDFLLPYCSADGSCAVGRCREVAATVERVGDLPAQLCVGHSDGIWDEMYAVLASARVHADVSSLDFPDNTMFTDGVEEGRFLVALRNALRYLDSTGEPVDVRLMFGWLVNDLDLDNRMRRRLATLTEGIAEDTALRIWAGALNVDLLSWNHSKIIAADGERLLQGGINFYSTDYLHAPPVHDLSMRINGEPARDGHRYLDELWFALAADWYEGGSGLWGDLDGTSSALKTKPEGLMPPPDSPYVGEAPAADEPLGVPVVSLGRLGLIDRSGIIEPAPSDDAMLAAIQAAQSSLRFALQDLGSVRDGVIVDVPGGGEIDVSYGWPVGLMETVAWRALDGVEVQLVISETGAGAYSYGWTKRELLEAWRDTLEDDDALHAAVLAQHASATDFLCERIALASPRVNATDETWSDGSAMGLHSKLWIVDDRAFYIGSQNLYISNLFEWGLLVDDPTLTAEVLEVQWAPLWLYSQRTSVSGPGVAECTLR
jgi:phosphatidylserine/phosphatidylglycerophosphate/cardiolipin synthase-like enzyme